MRITRIDKRIRSGQRAGEAEMGRHVGLTGPYIGKVAYQPVAGGNHKMDTALRRAHFGDGRNLDPFASCVTDITALRSNPGTSRASWKARYRAQSGMVNLESSVRDRV